MSSGALRCPKLMVSGSSAELMGSGALVLGASSNDALNFNASGTIDSGITIQATKGQIFAVGGASITNAGIIQDSSSGSSAE